MASDADGAGREARRPVRRRRTARRRAEGGFGVIIPGFAALLLIIGGGLLLARNLGYPLPGNWWALFILVPAIGCLASSLAYFRAGRFLQGMGSLVAAAFFCALAYGLFQGLAILPYWPVLLIVLGIVALTGLIGRR
jgi:hypothetical protein